MYAKALQHNIAEKQIASSPCCKRKDLVKVCAFDKTNAWVMGRKAAFEKVEGENTHITTSSNQMMSFKKRILKDPKIFVELGSDHCLPYSLTHSLRLLRLDRCDSSF